MQVSDEVKKAYHSDSAIKHLYISFPEFGTTIEESQIYQESLRLSEMLIDRESIEFVGCIASKFKIQINNLKEDVKGKKITVLISTEDTTDNKIPLFNGIVDSAMRQSNKRIKEIVAYDELYTKGNIDVAGWYKSITFPATLRQIRDSLFAYIGITQVETELPNDGITIQKQYDPNTLQALSVVKAICQINGAFGIINRQGKFEYRIPKKINKGSIVGRNLLLPFLLGGGSSGMTATEPFSFYKKVDYEEYSVKPVDKLTIRQSENDLGVTYGIGTNNYIIQGNMFTYGLTSDVLNAIAAAVYENVKDISFIPFSADNNGLPWVECGLDTVEYMVIDWNADFKERSEIPYKEESFYVLNRELSGIQALRDNYSAQGEEYQSEFITDLQTQIDIIKQNAGTDVKEYVKDYTYDKDYINDNFYNSGQIDDMFANFSSGGSKIVSLPSMEDYPSNPDSNTLYAVQGIVVVE